MDTQRYSEQAHFNLVQSKSVICAWSLILLQMLSQLQLPNAMTWHDLLTQYCWISVECAVTLLHCYNSNSLHQLQFLLRLWFLLNPWLIVLGMLPFETDIKHSLIIRNVFFEPHKNWTTKHLLIISPRISTDNPKNQHEIYVFLCINRFVFFVYIILKSSNLPQKLVHLSYLCENFAAYSVAIEFIQT